MSSLKNAQKSHQKKYKERGQLSSRRHLGLLEKHKDYVARARDYHKKEKQLNILRKKASEKNPDEFYFKMISQKTTDGVHTIVNEKKYTAEQLKLMKSQNLNYINFKRNLERKKIEKLQNELHMIDDVANHQREHVFFVDTEKEAKKFRKKQATANPNESKDVKHRTNAKPEGKKKRAYRLLEQRIQRERQLDECRKGLELQKNLMGKGRRIKIKKDGHSAFKWKPQRKR
ncbi:probable U3 small nucleolar RNA-associated protein 11 [Rhopilema esculentum]|uniref:probable U3 small nucleolar RNA-associated protein 11 n=1 Tax=Rhopilema esculentum TaxID=499914 RepID=UPI0031D1C27C